MPRPGPRPYECVRRAWHSDRHQPIRGSLIQDLFRVVNEIHSSSTRKNKEWQQKLPLVVLKAEEIMYSKANSESEYIDQNTLLERAKDAIDTIIRKEDSDDTGDFLQPCIEAALNLGCVARRSSRSERHNAPWCYLTSQEPLDKSINHLHHRQKQQQQQQRQRQCPYPSGFNLPITQPPSRGCPSYQFGAKVSPPGPPNYASSGGGGVHSFTTLVERRESQPASCSGFPRPSMEPTCSDSYPSSGASGALSSFGQVYPLYYCPSLLQITDLPVNYDVPVTAHQQWLNSSLDGDSSSSVGEVETSCLYDFLAPKDVEAPLDGSSSGSGNVCRNVQQESEFDLSLRLGPPSGRAF